MSLRPVFHSVENGDQLVASFGPFRPGQLVEWLDVWAWSNVAQQCVFIAGWANQPAKIEEDVDEAVAALPVIESSSFMAPANDTVYFRTAVNSRAQGRWLVVTIHHSTGGSVVKVMLGVGVPKGGS